MHGEGVRDLGRVDLRHSLAVDRHGPVDRAVRLGPEVVEDTTARVVLLDRHGDEGVGRHLQRRRRPVERPPLLGIEGIDTLHRPGHLIGVIRIDREVEAGRVDRTVRGVDRAGRRGDEERRLTLGRAGKDGHSRHHCGSHEHGCQGHQESLHGPRLGGFGGAAHALRPRIRHHFGWTSPSAARIRLPPCLMRDVPRVYRGVMTPWVPGLYPWSVRSITRQVWGSTQH